MDASILSFVPISSEDLNENLFFQNRLVFAFAMEERVKLGFIKYTQASMHDISQQSAKMDHCEAFGFPVPPKAFKK